MTSPEVLDLLERFQTTIVGVVGFFGVIGTLIANARISRVEQRRQIVTKRRTLRRILAAEFRNYSRALKENVEAPSPEGGVFSVGKIRRLLSDSLNADLGLLENDELDVVINALISLDGFNHYLENLAQQNLETRFLFPEEVLPHFRSGAGRMAEALDLAIDALESFDER
ncbi:hypothetical protein [Thioclava electrotropha]|uniref:DUF4760 domain-containing protein n=1 Tax=Thioclava electrotropha TaxID=1549850 RepID=A0ABX6YQY5_9RHOB|nr:hypothetical protein [Thioclava electrotropha]QPZ89685.1 hypothetical protein AKL02_001490 [Thioclava electrotropha]